MIRIVTALSVSLFFLISGMYAQTEYSSGNAAYRAEKELGYNPVTIAGGTRIYEFDYDKDVYRFEGWILIPDLIDDPEGNAIQDSIFFGFGEGGAASDTAFQWDEQTFLVQPDRFDCNHLFVSPLSQTLMPYASALQYNAAAGYDVIIDPPAGSLVYAGYTPACDTFYTWEGEELINPGDLKGTGIDHKLSQQQSDTTEHCPYCAKTYGPGWRLPTDIEAGHFNDLEGTGNGWDDAYKGISPVYIWTSSLFKIYNVKRWPLGNSDGYWENCAGFLYVENHVRCVFSVSDQIVGQPEITLPESPCRIFPNPVYDILVVKYAGKNIAGISITDLSGRFLYISNFCRAENRIDMHTFAPGMYILIIKENGQSAPLTYKIFKQ